MKIRPSEEQIRTWAQQWLELGYSTEVQRIPEAVRDDIFRFLRKQRQVSSDAASDAFDVEMTIDYVRIMERILCYVENRPW